MKSPRSLCWYSVWGWSHTFRWLWFALAEKEALDQRTPLREACVKMWRKLNLDTWDKQQMSGYPSSVGIHWFLRWFRINICVTGPKICLFWITSCPRILLTQMRCAHYLVCDTYESLWPSTVIFSSRRRKKQYKTSIGTANRFCLCKIHWLCQCFFRHVAQQRG